MAKARIKAELVSTSYARSLPRDRGDYDSSEQLPSVEKVLDRTIAQIRHIYSTRNRTPKAFERLWKKVCDQLTETGNASAFARWKQDDIVRNLKQFEKLDAAAEGAWAASLIPKDPSNRNAGFFLDEASFQMLREERSRLKPDVEISTDNVLEIAIAYWIEAMNAHTNGDELRAMHALIQCHFNLGIAHSLRMTHDSRSDGGRQSGKKERDALAEVVLKVMENLTVDRSIRGPDFLYGKISKDIVADPANAKILEAYEQTRGGRPAQDTILDRLPGTLEKWITGKEQLYPKITVQFRRLAGRIRNQSPIKNSSRRKANS